MPRRRYRMTEDRLQRLRATLVACSARYGYDPIETIDARALGSLWEHRRQGRKLVDWFNRARKLRHQKRLLIAAILEQDRSDV